MIMTVEEKINQLFENDKNKEIEEIKLLFKNNSNLSKSIINYYNIDDILCYLMINNASLDTVKYVIEEQQKKQQAIGISNIITKSLFYSIEHDQLEIAQLLLSHGANIENKNEQGQNIIEYLLKVNALTSKKLTFILNSQQDANLITGQLIIDLIHKKEIELLKKIIQYRYYDTDFIKEFLFIHKHGSTISNEICEAFITQYNHGIIRINDKNEEGNYPLLCAIDRNKNEMVDLILKYALTHHVDLEINAKNNKGHYPLLGAMYRNESIVKLLLSYATTKNITVELNEKDENGNYPLLVALDRNNSEVVKLLMDYASANHITLNINDTNSEGDYPLLMAVERNNMEKVKLLMEYASTNHLVLEINKKNSMGYTPLLRAMKKENLDMIKLLMEYASTHHILLDINEKEKDDIENNVLLMAMEMEDNSYSATKLLMKYAKENHVQLDINIKDEDGNSPLLKSIYNNNLEMVQLLIDYATSNNIKLEINGENEDGDSALSLAICHTNKKMIKLLMDYAETNHVILNITEKDDNDLDLMQRTLLSNDIELVKLFLNYASKNHIILDFQNNPIIYEIINHEMVMFLKSYSDTNNMEIRNIDIKINQD